jgi:UTP--glucose-1-phosphate uridylyltransferase
MAIHDIPNAGAIQVPRSRYRPVNTTSELLQAQSELYMLEDGMLQMHPKRVPPTVPLVKLGEEFADLSDYEKRFKSVPNLLELDSLIVSGNVIFRANVTLKVSNTFSPSL